MWLCNEIIQKYYALLQSGFQHNYISTDRIWLKLKPETEKFKIINSRLHYYIHFVGYTCPFYERQDYEQYQIKDESAIQQIIIEILRIAQTSLRRSVLQKANEKKIFTQLHASINKGLSNFQMQVISIIDDNVKQKEQKKIQKKKTQLNPINDDQRLSKIDRHYVNSTNRRGRRIDDVSKNIQDIVKQYYNQTDWYLFEVLFYQTVPLLVKAIKDKFSYSKVKPIFELKQNSPDDYLQIGAENIYNLIKQFEVQKNDKFKFDIDLKDLKSNILINLSKAKIKLHYFYNNAEFTINFNDQLKNQILIMKQQILEDYAQQIYEEMVEEKIYELTQDLI